MGIKTDSALLHRNTPPTTIAFRRACLEDMQLYFQWANEKSTRANSFNSSPITLEDHQKWFNKQLIDPNVELYLMQQNGSCIGQIRFQINDSSAMINYSIDKESRGKDFAKYLIKGGIEYLIKRHPQINKIFGLVKMDNYPSIKAFRRVGFNQEFEFGTNTQLKFTQILS